MESGEYEDGSYPLGLALSSSPKRKNFSPSEGIRRVGWHFSARVSSECGVPNSEGFVGECYAISQPYPSNVHTLRTFPVNICDWVIWSRSHLGQERSLFVLCSSQKQSEHVSLQPFEVLFFKSLKLVRSAFLARVRKRKAQTWPNVCRLYLRGTTGQHKKSEHRDGRRPFRGGEGFREARRYPHGRVAIADTIPPKLAARGSTLDLLQKARPFFHEHSTTAFRISISFCCKCSLPRMPPPLQVEVLNFVFEACGVRGRKPPVAPGRDVRDVDMQVCAPFRAYTRALRCPLRLSSSTCVRLRASPVSSSPPCLPDVTTTHTGPRWKARHRGARGRRQAADRVPVRYRRPVPAEEIPCEFCRVRGQVRGRGRSRTHIGRRLAETG